MRLRPTLFIIALATLFVQSGCLSKKPSNVVEVATFADTVGIAALTEQLAYFEKKTGIKTKPVYIPYANFSQKVISQLAASNAPDVLWVEVGFYVELQAAGALKPLDEHILKDKVDLKEYYSGVMARFSRQGKVWALPSDTAPIACLYYNRKMFRDAGVAYPTDTWTWNDLLAAAKKLTKRDKDGRTTVWGYNDGYGPDWQNWAYANGGALVDDVKAPTRSLIAEPATVEAVKFLQSLIYEHKVMPTQAGREMMDASAVNIFKTEKLAMFHSGYWNVGGLRKDTPDLDWDIAPFPKGPRAKRFGWGSGGSGWAMSLDARNDKDAWQVLKFLAGEEYQTRQQQEGGYQPGLKRLANSKLFLSGKPANSKMMLWAPDYAIYSPEIPEFTEIQSSVIGPAMDTVMLQHGDAAATLKAVAAEVDKRLASRKK